MLEAEEVDDDFFTPVAGTSLANIFGNPVKDEKSENDSLKYIPPKPQMLSSKNQEQAKATECVFACALIGHEWCNNVYNSRGKLGFAIVKIQKTGLHNIILYDSHKTTLSSTNISVSLVVTVRNHTYISYYDNHQKYWSIYGTIEEIKKICGVLESLGAKVNYSENRDRGPPEPNKAELEDSSLYKETEQVVRESDTDSSVNRKTKASILNRMANMGHSVLPTRTQIVKDSSESSDTNETDHPKAIRHKSRTLKKNTAETVMSEPQNTIEAQQRTFISSANLENNIAVYSGQMSPLKNTSIITTTSNELSVLMSEQRISNSELRINMNRIADKVDYVINKINDLEPNYKNANISTDILMKLLKEYECKIKTYEELLKSQDRDDKGVMKNLPNASDGSNEIEILNQQLSEIKKENSYNCSKITSLENELKSLKNKHLYDIQNYVQKEKELYTRIEILESDVKIKTEEMSNLTNTVSTENERSNENIHNKVKDIMNETFQTISMNFVDTNTYTGETVKRVIGTVIKKNTIKALSEL